MAMPAIAALAPASLLGKAKEDRLILIEAPSNLGLRPPSPGREPGTWAAPRALRAAGFHEALGNPPVVSLPRPRYVAGAVSGSNIRNGPAIREFSSTLGISVANALASGRFPVVLGGDCSILLGSLLGARASGRCGLIHIDGHSDFFQPDPARVNPPFSAAGMDLALATGRGEALLASWPEVGGALVDDADVLQLGEREELDADYAYPEISKTAIARFPVRAVLRSGISGTVERIASWAAQRGLARVWLHIDVDVLDQTVLPAVDTPGSPGLGFEELGALVSGLRSTVPVIGTDVTIFDPDLDPDGSYARKLVATLGPALSGKPMPALPPENASTSAMLKALGAEGPSSRNERELGKFGRLIGSWDLEVISYAEDGSVRRRSPGEWHFGWVLEGRAVQDVWIVPPRGQRTSDGHPAGEYGTTIRFYDEVADLWRSTWIGPVHRIVWPFTAKATHDEIVLERPMENGELTRWIFSNITSSSFHWRSISSRDGGNTWALEQEMFARRARPA